jgi:hypothetical protein
VNSVIANLRFVVVNIIPLRKVSYINLRI